MTTMTKIVAHLGGLTEEQRRQVLEFIEKLVPQPRRPLVDPYGLFKGYETTEAEIAEARGEMWGNFPRGDF